HREGALDADALADLAHRECLAQARATHVDDLAAELLLAFLVALDHAHRHLDGVPRTHLGTVRPDLSGLDFLDQAHEWAPFCTKKPGSAGPRWRRGSIGDEPAARPAETGAPPARG